MLSTSTSRCTWLRPASAAAAAPHGAAPHGRAAPRRAPPPRAAPSPGVFVCSGSPAIAEALAHSGLDWICIDAQHGAVDYSRLHDMLAATGGGPARRIVRVGGPDDRYGMQQALE